MTTITYRSYLRLPELLDCQTPLSDAHDELLFISIHQASEIWLKLSLHELFAARTRIAADDLPPAFKMMARVARVMAQLIQSWEVLATMTPADYAAMRGRLGTSSGFQSDQYRRIEFLLGNKNAQMLKPYAHRPNVLAEVKARAPRPLEAQAPGAPNDLISIATKAMARDRDQRYASAHELAEELNRFQTGRLVAAQPIEGGTPLADPFAKTIHLRRLLDLRAAQIREPRGRAMLRRLVRRSATA